MMPIPRKMISLTPAALLVTLAGTALGQSTDPFPAQFELSSLLPANGGDGSDGFVLNGVDAYDFSGVSVSSAGDVNGDGIDDLIIGADQADPNGTNLAGESYVVFGGIGIGAGGVIDLATLNGTNGFVLNGIDASDYSGASVALAGDVNGDGIGDLIIGAWAADPNGNYSGESYVVFGRDTAVSGDFPASLNLSALDGTNGFVLNGIDAYDNSGDSISSAGDINGDGIDDIIIGVAAAYPNGNYNAGESYVVFGRDTAMNGNFPASLDLDALDGSNGFVINGIDPYDFSGVSVSSAGDFNGDGIDDLIIGADGADLNEIEGAGESYVLFGAVGLGLGGVIELSSLDGTNGFVISGIDFYDHSGASVALAGDVNGDGIGDLIIGAWAADPNGNEFAGQTYLVFGRNTAMSGKFAAQFELSSLLPANGGDGSAGLVLNGVDENDNSGDSISSAGDVNGDGIDDLIIGVASADLTETYAAGQTYLIFGRDTALSGNFPASLDLSALDGATGFVINGIDAFDESGGSVSSAGDVNGDGIDDLIIGAQFADPNGNYSGESYVVFGRNVPAGQIRRIRNFTIDGPASAIAARDLGSEPINGMFGGPPDWLIDLVVTIPDGANPDTAAGFATILFNQGNTQGGSWFGYGEQVSLEVGADPSSIAVGKLDNDKWDDLLITNRADDSVTAILGDGMSFVDDPITSTFQQLVNTAPSSLVISDLDGSPGQDAAIANEGANEDGNSVTILTNEGGLGATWGGLRFSSTETVGTGPVWIALLNADNDKWDDLITANFTASNLSFLHNLGGTGFAPQRVLDLAASAGPRQVIVADLDGDGDQDLATANETGDSVSIIENLLDPMVGDIDFAPRIDVTVSGGPISIAAIDVDLDGDPDLVVVADDGSGTNHVLKVLRNDTSPITGVLEFTPDGKLPSGFNPRFVLGADVSPSVGDEIVMTNTIATVTVVDRVAAICLGDSDLSLAVSFQDITSVLFHWLTVYPPSTTGVGDANGDGVVNFEDITTVLGSWLEMCP